MTDIKVIDQEVIVYYDEKDGISGNIMADLVIAADGPQSKTRQILEPHWACRYVGYVAWRGTMVEKEMSEEARRVLNPKTMFCGSNRSYILVYGTKANSTGGFQTS